MLSLSAGEYGQEVWGNRLSPGLFLYTADVTATSLLALVLLRERATELCIELIQLR